MNCQSIRIFSNKLWRDKFKVLFWVAEGQSSPRHGFRTFEKIWPKSFPIIILRCVCIGNTPWCVWVHSLYECTFGSKYESLFPFNSSLMKYAWLAFTCSIQNMMIQIPFRHRLCMWLQWLDSDLIPRLLEYLIN